jgi:calcineurin-like phosphoesterase family protein
MIFFTSDQHFNHTNIIKYCHRPFNNIEHMNEEIIKRWNSKVTSKDCVYVLGDFVFIPKIKIISEIVNQLNGRIFLLKGDHGNINMDSLKDKVGLVDPIVELVPTFPLVNIKTTITLCHWCMRVWPKSHYNSWHLYGHSHGTLPPEGKSHDIGVDNNNFYPLSLDEIIELMKFKPDNFNLVKPEDQHKPEFEQMEMELRW